MNKIKVINLYQYGGASNPQYNTRSRTTDDTVDFTPKKKKSRRRGRSKNQQYLSKILQNLKGKNVNKQIIAEEIRKLNLENPDFLNKQVVYIYSVLDAYKSGKNINLIETDLNPNLKQNLISIAESKINNTAVKIQALQRGRQIRNKVTANVPNLLPEPEEESEAYSMYALEAYKSPIDLSNIKKPQKIGYLKTKNGNLINILQDRKSLEHKSHKLYGSKLIPSLKESNCRINDTHDLFNPQKLPEILNQPKYHSTGDWIIEPRMRNPFNSWNSLKLNDRDGKELEPERCDFFEKHFWCPKGANCEFYHASCIPVYRKRGERGSWMLKKRAPSDLDKIPVCDTFRTTGKCANGTCCSKIHLWSVIGGSIVRNLMYYYTLGFEKIFTQSHLTRGGTRFNRGNLKPKQAINSLIDHYEGIVDDYIEFQEKKMRDIQFYHTLNTKREATLKGILWYVLNHLHLEVTPENIKNCFKNVIRIFDINKFNDPESIYIKEQLQLGLEPNSNQGIFSVTDASKPRQSENIQASVTNDDKKYSEVVKDISDKPRKNWAQIASQGISSDNIQYFNKSQSVLQNATKRGLSLTSRWDSLKPRTNQNFTPQIRNTRFDTLKSNFRSQNDLPQVQNTRFDTLKSDLKSQNYPNLPAENTRAQTLRDATKNIGFTTQEKVANLLHENYIQKKNYDINEFFNQVKEMKVYNEIIQNAFLQSDNCEERGILLHFKQNILKGLWPPNFDKSKVNEYILQVIPDNVLFEMIYKPTISKKYSSMYDKFVITSYNEKLKKNVSFNHFDNNIKNLVNYVKKGINKLEQRALKQLNTKLKEEEEARIRERKLERVQGNMKVGASLFVVSDDEDEDEDRNKNVNNKFVIFNKGLKEYVYDKGNRKNNVQYRKLFFELKFIQHFKDYLQNMKGDRGFADLYRKCIERTLSSERVDRMKQLEIDRAKAREEYIKQLKGKDDPRVGAWDGEGKIKIKIHNLLF